MLCFFFVSCRDLANLRSNNHRNGCKSEFPPSGRESVWCGCVWRRRKATSSKWTFPIPCKGFSDLLRSFPLKKDLFRPCSKHYVDCTVTTSRIKDWTIWLKPSNRSSPAPDSSLLENLGLWIGFLQSSYVIASPAVITAFLNEIVVGEPGLIRQWSSWSIEDFFRWFYPMGRLSMGPKLTVSLCFSFCVYMCA